MAGGAYQLRWGTAPTGDASHTVVHSPSAGVVEVDGAEVQLKDEKGIAGGYASLDGSAVVPDAQVSESSVTQHEAALAIATSQLTGTLADARVAESNVTQHEAALSIAASQLSDDVPATSVSGPVITAVGATHTFVSADNGKCLYIDDSTDLAVTLDATGPAANDILYICCTGTGNLSFTGAGTIHFDSATYAAGPVATGKYFVTVLCVATGVYYIFGELDLA